MSAPDPDVALTITTPPELQSMPMNPDDVFLPRPVQISDNPPSDKHIA